MSGSVVQDKVDRKLTAVCVSRYLGQSAILDDGAVIITVVKVEGDRVYLRIQAPPEMSVTRPPKEQDKVDRIRRESW